MILSEAMVLLAWGLGVGLALSLLASRTADKLIYGLKPHDLVTLVSAALLLAIVTVAASALPARRAAHLEPTIALREE